MPVSVAYKNIHRLAVLLSGVLFMLLLSVLLGTWVLGAQLVKPQQTALEAPPTALKARSVKISSSNPAPVCGWFLTGLPHQPAVLLLHSIRSNRQEMLGRAQFLQAAGYTVLLIDMQAHGETTGEQITFGLREALDAQAALAYLRKRVPTKKVAVMGVSLGGAAALLGEQPLAADAFVLEAVYSSIEQALNNRLRLRLGKVGPLVAPLLLAQLKPRLGVPPEQLSPLKAIRQLRAPLLLIAGDQDQHTLPAESLAMYQAAQGPKSLWMIKGAQHQNFYDLNPQIYQQRVLRFLETYL